MSDKRMSRLEMFLFAAGDIFGGGGQTLISVVYLIFLTNVLKIDPAWAGVAVFVSKAWDAVNDPLMGYLSDNARTRMGRRRPFLLAGGSLIIVAMALMWLPVGFSSQAAKVAYICAAYLFYCTVSTIVAVPYSSMSTEITADFNECNKVNVLRLTFSLISTALCTLVPSMLFERYTKGLLSYQSLYLILVLGFGAMFALPLILAGLYTRERVAYEDKRVPLSLNTVVKPFRVRAFRKLMGMYLCQAVTLDMVSAVILYYALYVVAGLDSTVFLGTFLGVQLLMFPLIQRLVGRVGKTKIYRFGLPLAVVGSFLIAFYPSGFPVEGIYVCTFLTAVGFAGAQNMSWIIFPDVVDIGEMGLGERNTGSFGGVMTFVRTISSAIAVFLIGVALSAAGYVKPTLEMPIPVQPEGVLTIIRLMVFLPFGLLMSYAWVLARSLRLTPQVSQRVKHFNARLQSGGLASLSQQERLEYDALMREFVGVSQ